MQSLVYCIFVYNKLSFVSQLICYGIEILLMMGIIRASYTERQISYVFTR